jgi:hypothetical protein
MTGDRDGQAAGKATLLVRAVDGILGTHRTAPMAFGGAAAQLAQVFGTHTSAASRASGLRDIPRRADLYARHC